MRTKILLMLVLIISTMILNAQDLQWLIKNSYGKGQPLSSTINNYNNSISPGYILLDGVVHLKPHIIINGNPIRYSNDFFGIFEDGSYHFGRNYNSSSLLVPGGIFPGSSYCFNTNSKTLAYLYLTNRYEEDDAPESIQISNNLCNSLGLSNAVYIEDELTKPLALNHDIVDQKDVTIIIDGSKLSQSLENRKISCNEFKLCYSLENYPKEGILFIPQNFNVSNSLVQNLTSSGTILDDGGSYTFLSNDSCFKFTNDGGNLFINFNVKVENPDIVGEMVNFTLYCEESNEDVRITGEKEQISGLYHDPNFVELQCVWESGTKKYARYHVECFNDSENAGVNNVGLSVELPILALSSTVKVHSWGIGCNNGCGENPLIFNTTGQVITIDFSGSGNLDEFNDEVDSCEFTAWFEFCVELDPNTDLEYDDLKLLDPHSLFDGTPYIISNYIQTDTIVIDTVEMKPLGRVVRKVGNYCNTCCNCNSLVCFKNITLPISIAVVVILISVYLIRRRKKDLSL